MSVTTIEEALKKVLTDNAGVAAILAGRVYPVILPQNVTYPALAYQKVTGAPDMALDGESGLTRNRFQIDAYGETYAAVRGLSKAVRTALNGKKFTVDAVRIGSVVMISERDFYEEKTYRVSMDFSIWHNA